MTETTLEQQLADAQTEAVALRATEQNLIAERDALARHIEALEVSHEMARVPVRGHHWLTTEDVETPAFDALLAAGADAGLLKRYAREVESLARRVPAVPKDAGWRPIETAPKDGSSVLLLGRNQRPADSYWQGQTPHTGKNHWVWPYVHREPTHWVPQRAKQRGAAMNEEKPDALHVAAVGLSRTLFARVSELEAELQQARASLAEMTADRDSWKAQAFARVDDALAFAKEAEALRAALSAAPQDPRPTQQATVAHHPA